MLLHFETTSRTGGPMLIFEHCSFLKRKPISIDIKANKSESFRQLFHFHPCMEMIYVHEGVGRLIVEQHVYEVRPGSILFLKPYQPHYLQVHINPEQPYVRSLIRYDPQYVADLLKAFPNLNQFHDYLWRDPLILQVQHLPNPDQTEQFLKDGFQRIQLHPSRNRMEGNALFLISLLHFLQPHWKHYDARKHPSHTFSPVIAQIMSWIEENYNKEFQLEALSRAVHLSPSHLSHMFHKVTGQTITEYLTVKRLRQACLLLKTSTLSVQEIGVKSGWTNFTYFCQVFKKHIGMTPKRYRSH